MCKLKSAIILKDRIFIPDYDSHSQMLEELGIVKKEGEIAPASGPTVGSLVE